MKSFYTFSAFIAALSLTCLTSASAQLTYDYANNPGWFATDAWTNTVPAPANWSAGANAVIGVTEHKEITFDQNTTIGNLTLTGTSGVGASLNDSSARTLTFNGGTIDTSALLQTLGGVSIQGNFTKKGGGFIRLSGGAAAAAYAGTATVNAGSF